MIIRFKTILFVCCLLVLNACQKNDEFHFLDGREASLTDYRGSWLVVNFWAEWCAPCIEEFPELNELAKHSPEIKVIGVSFDKLLNQELRELAQKLDIQYPIIASEPMPYLPMARPQSLPANYIVTPKGEVLGPLLGTQTKENLLSVIEKIKEQYP